MPWRGTRDPYRIWVSEVMLQQTQVAIVTPYYKSFLERFPTLERLARAREDEVLAAWAGLGYYRRARHLHAAAREVVRDHAGRVPEDADRFGRLPGVGRYTTAAVLSIAFDRPLAVLDGNVARVLSRHFALPASYRDASGARRLWALAQTHVPMRDPGDWNQAVMELGATVCLPRAPRCRDCPLRATCRALALNRVAAFPPTAPRRATERVRRAIAVIEHDGRVLMIRREGRLLAGLWEPPGLDLDYGTEAGPRLRAMLRDLGVSARLRREEETLRHTITHRRIEVEVWRGAVTAAPPRSQRVRAIDPVRPGVALTALARKIGRR